MLPAIRSTFKTVIIVHQIENAMYIPRNRYLNELISLLHNGMIKIVTGIRRCGKINP